MAQTKVITTSSSGDTTILDKTTAGPGGTALGARQFFRVVWLCIITNSGTIISLYDGPSSTGTLKFAFPTTGNSANTGVMSGAPESGLFDCSPGNNLVLNSGTGVALTVNIGFSIQGN